MLRRFPRWGSSRRRDYLGVNDVLAGTFEQLRDELMDGLLWFRLLGDTALPAVRALRGKAWLDGAALWRLRKIEPAFQLYLRGLDAAARTEATAALLLKL